MTLGELLVALAERGSVLRSDDGMLRHRGPRLEEGDPIRQALATFRDEVHWLLTSNRLCVFCPRPLAEGDKTLCGDHQYLRGEHLALDPATAKPEGQAHASGAVAA